MADPTNYIYTYIFLISIIRLSVCRLFQVYFKFILDFGYPRIANSKRNFNAGLFIFGKHNNYQLSNDF